MARWPTLSTQLTVVLARRLIVVLARSPIEFIVNIFKWFFFLYLKWHAGRSGQGN